MDAIIKLENVFFSYESEEDALQNPLEQKASLRDITLEIERGSFVAVLGHNGSGKSTLAKLLNGFNHPQQGCVLVNGMDTKEEALQIKIRRTVGMVFQNPDNQLVATIVEEDVAFGPENLGIPPAEIRTRVDEALKAVDMYDYREHAPHKLSGGQKQRVAIAGVIAMTPECIVLDEPTAMLDPRGRREVLETIRKLNREQNITIILITHYMDEAAQADRVIVMDDGEVVMDGPPVKIFTQVEKIKSVGLDVPQPTELVYMLKKSGVTLPTEVLTVDECVAAVMKGFNLLG